MNKYYTANRRDSDSYTENSYTILPLKLCWALIDWKVQGMAIRDKIVAYLGKREADHGITYIILSRVYKFSDIGIKDRISKSRLYKAI